MKVVLLRGPHDHLGGLARRGELGGVLVEGQLRLALGDAVPNLGHVAQDGGLALVRA